MTNYYSEKLNALNLQRCYEEAPARIRQFLEAEIGFVLSKVRETDSVLDLGCGYGRVAVRLAAKAREVTGIDISTDNIAMARQRYESESVHFFCMDAVSLEFPDESFDLTICIQNGISAFKVKPELLLSESLRVTRQGGLLLFSSYSGKFWDERLDWFRVQSEMGLIGEIDYARTGNGIIICKDGFRAVTFTAQDFLALAGLFNVEANIQEVDNSSLFCEMIKR